MKRGNIYTVGLLAAFLLAGSQQAFAGCGLAAAYNPESQPHGKAGSHMDIAAAHKSLPLGTRVVVRNQRKGRSIVVRITDRSPSLLGGIIDLTADAMSALGVDVLTPVCVEVVTYGSKSRGYDKPSLLGRLLEAVNPQMPHYAKVGSRTRSAKAHGGRYAKVHHGRRRYAAVQHGSGRRYAKSHRSHSVRRSRHGRHFARG